MKKGEVNNNAMMDITLMYCSCHKHVYNDPLRDSCIFQEHNYMGYEG